MIEVIDISEHNVRGKRAIDWTAVKSSGVSAVMIRLGWAGYDGKIAANNGIDSSFDESIKGASSAGLDIGLYVYSYTKNAESARVAARECVDIAKKYPGSINYPIAFDAEETKLDCLTAQGKTGLSNTIAAFCEEILSLGYFPCWYTYTSFIRQYIDLAPLAKYDLWIADYRMNEKLMQSQIGRKYTMWQYLGDEGKCDGIEGACDRNYVYVNYPIAIRVAGQNGFSNQSSENLDWKFKYEQAAKERDQYKSLVDSVKNILR